MYISGSRSGTVVSLSITGAPVSTDGSTEAGSGLLQFLSVLLLIYSNYL